MSRPLAVLPALLIAATALAPAAWPAQWTNRYPKIDGMSHHVYLEGYELPTLTNGPIDAAPAPDGRTVAFSSRGWIWAVDLETGIATRLTSGGAMDFRPAWSSDGSSLAFVRDTGTDTSVVTLELATGEQRIFDTPAIDLDPAFTADGTGLMIASARQGTLDLWHISLQTDEWTAVTTRRGTELRPQPLADGRIVYLGKGGGDAVRVLDPAEGTDDVLITERITSMLRPAVSPDGATVAYNWPTQEGYELRLLSLDAPTTSVKLTASRGLPLNPAWSADGEYVWFSEANPDETMALRRIRAVGGEPETVLVQQWDWGEPTGTVRIRTRLAGEAQPAAARLEVRDVNGHPAIPGAGQPRFDGEHGRVFFYTDGLVELTVPAGTVQVGAVQGFATPEATGTVDVPAGGTSELTLHLAPVWDAAAAGWLSADHHFHLNYGGQYSLTPDDLMPMLRGEALDVATPLLANLHNRFEDQRFWGWESGGSAPLIRFGQEIRSHFLGHLGFIGTTDLHWPWVWGPGYQVYGTDDRPNTEATEFARSQGGLSTYVHPVSAPGASPPVELVADGIMGTFDLLEVVCLWSDELATADLWHLFLNIGVPIAPTAGSDVMNNFYRTMAVGATRVFVQTNGADDWASYAAALAAGRSFVSNGPMLEFQVDGSGPGETVPAGSVPWQLRLHTSVPVDRVEILVNGMVAWSADGPLGPHAEFEADLDLPDGGWIAARATGAANEWPFMDSYAFAQTAPVWIDAVGSTDPEASRRAAEALLPLLDAAEVRLRGGYGATPTPNILARFDAARARLETLLGG